MHPRIAAAFRAAPHLVTRSLALACLMTPRQVDDLVRRGQWVAVRRGVYAERTHVQSLAHRADRQRLYDDAAALATSLVHVRSHESAAVVWGMAVLLDSAPTTHFTVPLPSSGTRMPQRSRHRAGAKHHLAPYDDRDQPATVDGVRVLGRARTAADIAREHGLVPGVVAADAAPRDGVTPAELAAAPERMVCWPHVSTVRQAVDLADPGSESSGETLSRLMAEQLGRGRPQTQFGLSRDGRTAFVDLRLGRHLIEFDGRLKYYRGLSDGLLPEDVVWEEKKRQDWLGGFGTGMSRLTWSDVWPFGQPDVLARLQREADETDRRFGTDISDLAPYVVQRRRRPAA
ncbi:MULTISPECIES: hypothetical protein [unclassified Nocardioides]|uniref:hypothetical protein n=1 Tax=unclassified Nocardioides TaxID=2615069 RepID=UPI0030148A15